MATESGFSTQLKYGEAQHKTIHNLGSQRYGTSVSTKALAEINAIPIAISGVAVNPKDTREMFLEIIGHNARKYDVVRFMTGANVDYELEIIEVIDNDTIKILNIGTVVVGDEVKLMRWVTSKADKEGNLNFSPGPNTYIKDNANATVTEDGTNSANNKGLPSLAFIYKNGVQVPVADSDSDPNDVVAVPVKLTDVGGTNINITAGDINVQTSDMGENFDSQRIGDGSGNYLKVEADGSLNAKVDQTDTTDAIDAATAELQAIKAIDFAKETTLQSVLSDLGDVKGIDFAKDTTLSALSAKVDNLATEAKQDDLIAAIGAITFDKTGLATSAKQDTEYLKLTEMDVELENQTQALGDIYTRIGTSNTSLTSIDGKLTDVNTKLTEMDNAVDAMSAKLPATLGQKPRATSLAATLSTEDVAILTAMRDALNSMASAGQTLLQVDTDSPTAVTVVTFTPPAGAKQMQIINNAGANASSIRWVEGSQTPSSSNGALLVPSAQSPLLPAGAVKVISMEGTADVSVAWFG